MKTVNECLEDLENKLRLYNELKGKKQLRNKQIRKRTKRKKFYVQKLHKCCKTICSYIVQENSKWKCELDNEDSVCVHHIIYKSQCSGMRYDTDNLMAICNKHHSAFGKYGVHAGSPFFWELFHEKFPGRYKKLYKRSQKHYPSWSIERLKEKLNNLLRQYKGGY